MCVVLYLVIHHVRGKCGGGFHLVLGVVSPRQVRAVGQVNAACHQVARRSCNTKGNLSTIQ